MEKLLKLIIQRQLHRKLINTGVKHRFILNGNPLGTF